MPRAVKDNSPAPDDARPSAKPFRFGFLVHDVSRLRRTLFDQEMKPLDVTRSQWSVLAMLSRGGNNGVTQVDLARLLDVGKVTVGGLVDRLESSGHVERRPDPADRRAWRVFITGKGYDTIALMQGVGNALNASILAGVSEADLRVTEETLARVKQNILGLVRSSGAAEPDGEENV
ncbi:MAG: MarR family transcriptional regulator [Alphaproteobacteria bacterium]|nr:MarR family transcriptional regulator [Alphaproteobacteria bacterium]